MRLIFDLWFSLGILGTFIVPIVLWAWIGVSKLAKKSLFDRDYWIRPLIKSVRLNERCVIKFVDNIWTGDSRLRV